MWKPYTVTRRDDARVEYRYSPICSYWLYGTIALLIAGLVLDSPMLYYLAFASIAVYFVVVTLPGFEVVKAIKDAAASGDVEIRGSRWLPGNPLTFVVRQRADSDVSER